MWRRSEWGLKRTPRFHLAPRGGQNGARPGYGAILHGECTLDALKDLFGFPGRSGHNGGRAPAQGAHPSAGAALGVPNTNLPINRMVAVYHPLSKTTRAAIGRCASRVPKDSLGEPHEWTRHLKFVPGGLEGENRILEAATESPTAVFGRRWGHAALGPTAR